MKPDIDKKKIYGIKSFLAFVLRHKPFFYKIKLDNAGFANIDFVLAALNKTKNLNITKEDLIEIAKKYSGGIFQVDLDNNKIKAKSGHSVIYNMAIPDGFQKIDDAPKMLYCLVSKDDINKMVSTGGFTFANEQIALSPDKVSPMDGKSVLEINCHKAKSDSVKFYYCKEEDIYFTRHIPSQYISFHV